MPGVMDWVVLIGTVVIISIFWSVSICFVATSALGEKLSVRTCAQYSAIFTVLQIIANIILIQTGLEMHRLLWDIGLFTLHVVLLSLLLARTYNERFIKVLSAAAVSHFTLTGFFSILEGSLIPAMEALLPEWSLLGAALLYNIVPHAILLCFGLLIAPLLQKMHFHVYFSHLFSSRKKSVITMCACLILMNSYAAIALFFPGVEYTLIYAICGFIMIFIALFGVQFAAMYAAGQDKIRAQEAIIAQQQLHLGLLEDLQGEVRAFRHDYRNLLSGMALQASEGDIRGIQDFLRGASAYFDDRLGKEIHRLHGLSKIQIQALRSLVTTKLAMLRTRGLHIELEVMQPVDRAGMRTEDLLRCLGILLDNAAEGADEAGRVRVVLLQEEARLFIAIANTYESKPNLRDMQTAHYATKGKGRGTGLSSYHAIVASYPGCATRSYLQEDFFTQELCIEFAS